jgi:hypothetical protein
MTPLPTRPHRYERTISTESAYLQALAAYPVRPAQPPRWARVVPPPHRSRRALARAGVMWSPEVQRYETRGKWLTPRARRALSADLAAARLPAPTPRPDRRARRAIGAGPWPRLRRRAEAVRTARGA